MTGREHVVHVLIVILASAKNVIVFRFYWAFITLKYFVRCWILGLRLYLKTIDLKPLYAPS